MSDEEKNVINQTQITTPVEESKELNLKKGNEKSLILLLLVMVFSLLGLLVYLFITDRLKLGIDNPLSDTKVSINEDKEEPIGEEDDGTVPLKTHTNTTLWPYKLKYPQDWEITKENTECTYDSGSKQELCTFHELEISYIKNPDYAFYLHNCSECGPTPPYCAYSDVTYPDKMLEGISSQVFYENFVQIENGTYRRSNNSTPEENSGFNYRICVRGENEQDGVYYLWGGIIAGDIAYKAPNNADENILKVMDNILLSIEELPK